MMDAFKYYDEGWNARVRNKPMNKSASAAWKDGWKDCDEADPEDRELVD